MVERTHRALLIQPFARSRDNFQVRAGCSESCLVKFWMSPRIQVWQPLWASCSNREPLLKNGVFLLMFRQNFPCSNSCQMIFVLLMCISEKTMLIFCITVTFDSWKQHLGFPLVFFLQARQIQLPWPFLTGTCWRPLS